MRDAAIPITPWCQSSDDITITLSWEKSWVRSIISHASSIMVFSYSWRSRFMSHRMPAISLARHLFSVVNSSTATDALRILPAAFILGAMVYPIYVELTFRFFFLRFCSDAFALLSAAAQRASNPKFLPSSISFSPMLTISLFSPNSGITSAIVPTAAKSP